MRYCVIIPTYNNDTTLERVINGVSRFTGDIIVVNDGSTDSTSRIIDRLADDFYTLKVVSYPGNMGKGYAIRKGFELAVKEGYNYAITIDSDGQHDPADIPVFVAGIENEPDKLIIGDRNLAGRNISGGSRFANIFSNFWFRFLTGIKLKDTQTGFRLYPLDKLKSMRFITRKYEFETEVLVRVAWKGIEIHSVPVSVYYPPKEERISHYRFFRDFFRISILNTVLVIIALLYVKPFSFVKYLKKENIREFVNKHILLTRESNLKISLAIALGVFMGIVPIWGFQLIAALTLAHIFRLSKFLVAVAANISIPPMIPLILFLSYVTGGMILGTGSKIRFSGEITLRTFENNVFQYITGAIVFAAVFAVFAGLASFFILKLVRRRPGISG
jgi:glycosyltransferase involved in cell wall biosynthesis